MKESNITIVEFKRQDLGDMAEKIRDVVYEYTGRVSLAEAIGILEIVKIRILDDQKD